ncbi:MAG: ABC transporter ATP-binding protein [Lachnospiraceae bacterium]|nr:ABC transporter ATP-binding protein [Lachnospiraceae bacterium]
MLKVEHLNKTLSNKNNTFKLNNISFTLPKGYICGLMGENGSGKSSLIKCLTGLYQPDNGNIFIQNMPFYKNETKNKDMLGIVLDTNFYNQSFNLIQIGKYYGSLYNAFNYKQYLAYLSLFHLDSKKKFKHLSKGMKIKVQISFALSHNAKLFLFDEPEDGLDKDSRKELVKICTELVSDGEKSVLLSSHITEDLDRIADYIGYMQNGNMLFFLPKDTLCNKFRIIKGEYYKLHNIPKGKIVYMEKDKYITSAMVMGGNKYSSDKTLEVYKPCISEFMYYFVKGGNENAKNIAKDFININS